jgi:hypothetical protein
LALVYDAPAGAMLALHNLGDAPVTVDVGTLPEQSGDPMEIYADDGYPEVQQDLCGLELRGSGYRWLRLRSTPGR